MSAPGTPETCPVCGRPRGYGPADVVCWASYSEPCVTALRAERDKYDEALRSLYSVLRDRHHGRMPEDVQRAYDTAGAMLAGASPSEPRPAPVDAERIRREALEEAACVIDRQPPDGGPFVDVRAQEFQRMGLREAARIVRRLAEGKENDK